MSTQYKTYRFRMKPNFFQKRSLTQFAGARRFIWNWGLQQCIDHYEQTGEFLTYVDLSFRLISLKWKPETKWIQDIPAQSLIQVLMDLETSFKRFFEKISRFPKFKSRKTDRLRFRIQFNKNSKSILNNKIWIPKLGWVKFYKSQEIDGIIKSATFKRDALGHWYVTILVAFNLPDVRIIPNTDNTIGIDLGLIDFTTLSDDSDPTPAPKFYRKGQTKLRRASKDFSRSKKPSKRKDKKRLRLARVHRKIANQRQDFLHKETHKLTHKYDVICIEDLSLKGLARTKLAKSFLDASFGEFRRQLTYKCLWNHKTLVVIDRFFPSTKMCHCCGNLNPDITLSDRIWFCPQCGITHSRDRNAAINIRLEGLRILAVGQPDSINAHGDGVRPNIVGNCR